MGQARQSFHAQTRRTLALVQCGASAPGLSLDGGCRFPSDWFCCGGVAGAPAVTSRPVHGGQFLERQPPIEAQLWRFLCRE